MKSLMAEHCATIIFNCAPSHLPLERPASRLPSVTSVRRNAGHKTCDEAASSTSPDVSSSSPPSPAPDPTPSTPTHVTCSNDSVRFLTNNYSVLADHSLRIYQKTILQIVKQN